MKSRYGKTEDSRSASESFINENQVVEMRRKLGLDDWDIPDRTFDSQNEQKSIMLSVKNPTFSKF